jgi:hypothetical protein
MNNLEAHEEVLRHKDEDTMMVGYLIIVHVAEQLVAKMTADYKQYFNRNSLDVNNLKTFYQEYRYNAQLKGGANAEEAAILTTLEACLQGNSDDKKESDSSCNESTAIAMVEKISEDENISIEFEVILNEQYDNLIFPTIWACS